MSDTNNAPKEDSQEPERDLHRAIWRWTPFAHLSRRLLVDFLDEPYELDPAPTVAASPRSHAYWIPVALIAIAAAAVVSAYLAGVPIASAGP